MLNEFVSLTKKTGYIWDGMQKALRKYQYLMSKNDMHQNVLTVLLSKWLSQLQYLLLYKESKTNLTNKHTDIIGTWKNADTM